MTPPRSLADDLRRRDDAALGRLLRLRPDLLHPVPADFTSLTARATAGPSVSRCLDGLDALELHVLACVARTSEPAPRERLVDAASDSLGAEARSACEDALDSLLDRALVWGDDDALRAISSVIDLVRGVRPPSWPPAEPHADTLTDVDRVDAEAGLHARAFLALVRDLLDAWAAAPPTVLRTGGLALREFAAVRQLLHADWATAALVIEVAQAARLVDDDGEEEPRWVPTDRFDTWLQVDPAEAWLELVDAWRGLARLPSLATAKTKVLVSDDDRRAVPVLRQEVLDLLAEVPPGATLTPESIATVLDHRRPRRGGELRRQVVAATLREASDLGLIASGALASAGRLAMGHPVGDTASRRDRAQAVRDCMSATMPAEVDHVLINPDLTLVAPGPLAPSIGRQLGRMADIESRGHATVYRISDASVRRAFDAGWDAEGVLDFLTGLSRTPVPQPLAYLVQDIARRHGAVRVGTALSYLRSDTSETLLTMLEDRRLRALGLRRVADTVLVSLAPTHEVLDTLRQAGFAPAAEGPDGGIVIRRPEAQRIRAPRGRNASTSRPSDDALLDAAVRTLRAGDRARGPRASSSGGITDTIPRLPASAIVSALRRAIGETMAIGIGYADTDGTVTEQIVDPLRLSAGILTAFDHRIDGVRTFAVSRITGVADPE